MKKYRAVLVSGTDFVKQINSGEKINAKEEACSGCWNIFEFGTQAELEAFVKGIDACDGWYENRVLDPEDPDEAEELKLISGYEKEMKEFMATDAVQESEHDVDEIRFVNYYKCSCGKEWKDLSPTMCNDRCPSCGFEIEPHHSIDLPKEPGGDR